ELQRMAQGLGVSGYQRLRKGDLIEAIMTKSASPDGAQAPPDGGEPNGDAPSVRVAGATAPPAAEEAEGQQAEQVEQRAGERGAEEGASPNGGLARGDGVAAAQPPR